MNWLPLFTALSQPAAPLQDGAPSPALPWASALTLGHTNLSANAQGRAVQRESVPNFWEGRETTPDDAENEASPEVLPAEGTEG